MRAPAAGVIQTKLTINQPGDEYEQEADRVAEQVMRMPEPELQRPCPCGGGCPNCQQEQSGLQQGLQMKHVDGSSFGQTAAPGIAHETLRSSGQPLDATTRGFMESRFRHDFSGVRVHTDGQAARSARMLNASAYTIGREIVFGSGLYAPRSDPGRRLLAHELSHVLQQRNLQRIQRKNPAQSLVEALPFPFAGREPPDAILIFQQALEIYQGLLKALTSRHLRFKGSNDREREDSLRAHILARVGIVNFARGNRFRFTAGDISVNEKYWEYMGDTEPRLKDESKRKEAYLDLHEHPLDYELACKAGTAMTMQAGSGSAENVPYNNVDESDWIPGDWGYIKNTGKKPHPGDEWLAKYRNIILKNPRAGEEGQNIIYLGKNQFWGLSKGEPIRTREEWFNQVKDWNGAAEIENWRKGPDTGLLLKEVTGAKGGPR
jgi:hypothetical protein